MEKNHPSSNRESRISNREKRTAKSEQRTAIPYGRQNITPEDIAAVTEVLQADFLTQGPRIPEFENAFAEYIGSKYAVAISNGTAALHLCAMALGVKPGQKVVTTPITFAASANCVAYCGGEVIFSDIDPDTYLLDLDRLEASLKSWPENHIAGVVAVDFAGRAVDMERLRNLADQYGFWIIEDSCHAPGGYFIDSKGQQQSCGNGTYADLAIFSFHPVKHIATGEGGMITTNNSELYEHIARLRTHGITRDESLFENSIDLAGGNTSSDEYPGWYMEMVELGYNYRITDIQCALGSSQLKRAQEGINRRREIASRYTDALTDQPFIYGMSGSIEGHAYHLFVAEVDDRLGLYNYLREKKIFPQIHYVPTHMMPYYQRQGWKHGDMPHAEKYYSRCISLPMYPTLTNEEQDFVIQTIKDFYLKS